MKLLKLEEMTLEQKIGQLICARGWIDEDDKAYILDMIRKRALGGIQGAPDVKRKQLVSEMQEFVDYPILVCADMESGIGEVKYPMPMGIASTGDTETAYQLARATAIEAKKMGINVVWGPVVDFVNPEAVCSVPRCFGENKDSVSEYTNAMIRGFCDEGMVCTAKHFGMSSDITYDTHMRKGISEKTAAELLNDEIVPYIRAMKEVNLPGIMTGHILQKKVDSKYVASLSKNVIDLIRNEGFDGLVVTDSLAMMGIVQDYGLVECLGLAIAAGNDMVLPNFRLRCKESFEYLMKAYKEGVFSEERLNDAVRHVLEAQEKTLKVPSMSELDETLRDVVESSKRKSIVGIYEDGYTSEISKEAKKLFVVLCENTYPDIEGYNQEVELSSDFSRNSRMKLINNILCEFPEARCMLLSEYPHGLEIDRVCIAASEADEVVFFTYATCGAYLGTNCITKRVEALINANAEKLAAIVHVGNPYDLAKFPRAKRRFNCILQGDSENYIIKALKGQFVPSGKLPVEMD